MDLSKYIFKTKRIATGPSTIHRVELEDGEFLLNYKISDSALGFVSIETVQHGCLNRYLEIRNADSMYEHTVVLLIAGVV